MTAAYRGLGLGLLLLGSGCVLTVANGHVDSPDFGTDPVATGRRAYVARCASCHGLEARGDGPVGDALRTAPPDLTWLAERSGGAFPRDYVIAVITGSAAITAHGTREMPVWSDRLAPADGDDDDDHDGDGAATAAALYLRRTIEALADYLATVQRRSSAAAPRSASS